MRQQNKVSYTDCSIHGKINAKSWMKYSAIGEEKFISFRNYLMAFVKRISGTNSITGERFDISPMQEHPAPP